MDIAPSKAHGASSPVAVLQVCDADFEHLRDGLVSWSAGMNIEFGIAGCGGVITSSMRAVLNRMMRCRAFVCLDEEHHFVVPRGDSDTLQVLLEMQSLSLVCKNCMQKQNLHNHRYACKNCRHKQNLHVLENQ